MIRAGDIVALSQIGRAAIGPIMAQRRVIGHVMRIKSNRGVVIDWRDLKAADHLHPTYVCVETANDLLHEGFVLLGQEAEFDQQHYCAMFVLILEGLQ